MAAYVSQKKRSKRKEFMTFPTEIRDVASRQCSGTGIPGRDVAAPEQETGRKQIRPEGADAGVCAKFPLLLICSSWERGTLQHPAHVHIGHMQQLECFRFKNI